MEFRYGPECLADTEFIDFEQLFNDDDNKWNEDKALKQTMQAEALVPFVSPKAIRYIILRESDEEMGTNGGEVKENPQFRNSEHIFY